MGKPVNEIPFDKIDTGMKVKSTDDIGGKVIHKSRADSATDKQIVIERDNGFIQVEEHEYCSYWQYAE
jgi:hypothetical protein